MHSLRCVLYQWCWAAFVLACSDGHSNKSPLSWSQRQTSLNPSYNNAAIVVLHWFQFPSFLVFMSFSTRDEIKTANTLGEWYTEYQWLELSSLPMTIRSCNVDVHTVKTKVFPCVFSSYILITQSKFFSSGTRVLGFEKKYGFRKNGYNWIIWPTSRHGDDLHRLNVVTKIPQQVQKYFQHAFGI